MAINPALLIAAPMLQDSFVDKDGSPMSGGTVTCFADNSRTTLKNWYYQTGTPGNYTYVPLPNPLTLSAAGTICDINGVDTIPFFYPFAEALSPTGQYIVERYFITIVNHAQTNQITRANFPYNIDESINGNTNPELDNLIINNGFWRNVGTMLFNNTPPNNITSAIVCPSQHDGFRYPDIQFIKNNTTATDTITFTKFPLSNSQALTGDVTPEFYINHDCSNAGSSETQKCYQFPVQLHVNVLANFQFTFTIQAQNIGGTATGQNVLKIFLLQDTGTGTSSPTPTLLGQISVSTSWTKYSFSSVFPATSGLTLGNGGDDGWYIQVQLPLNLDCNINFTSPSLYLATTSPTNAFLTYDQVNSVISSPRTGDIRITTNPFYNSGNKWVYGWVPMNNGTIGSASSNATTRPNTDTWQLYNLIWNFAVAYDTGGTFNAIAQIYTSLGVVTNYGASAIADFNANKQLSLTRAMGEVFLGTVPIKALLAGTPTFAGWSSVVTDSSSSGLLFTTDASNLLAMFVGSTVTFTNTGGALNSSIQANAVYYVVPQTTTTFKISTTFANAIANVYVPFGTPGSGTTTAFLQTTGSIEGEYAHQQSTNELATHQHAFLNSTQTGVGVGTYQNGGATEALQSTFPATVFTDFAGLGGPANITQPGVFNNIFIKL